MMKVLLCLFCVLTTALSLNILGLFPHPGKSHFDVFEPLLKALAAKGHNLTVISFFPQKTPLLRYTDIDLQGDTGALVNAIDVNEIPQSRIISYLSIFLLAEFGKKSCDTLQMDRIKQLVDSDQQFDLILIETFNTDCYLSFVHKYKVPFIGMSSCTIMPWSHKRFGNPVNPSYIPINLLPHSNRMGFLERLENTIFYIFAELIYHFRMQELGHDDAKQLFGNDLPPFKDIANNISLLLVNTHFSLNLPRPQAPNVIEVGGMFLNQPKPLPKDIEKFINESTHGVIYFSMGSLIKAHTFPVEKRQVFLNVFSKLKQRVLWKWENETMQGKPDNVLIKKWMPQFDILCHPNVKGFLAHGGLLGSIETVHCGVPVIIFPQFGDQSTNAKALEANGVGVIANFASITEESLMDSLNTILDPSFNKRTKDFSAVYRDRQQSPMDTAIYWTEYVARYKGAPFMRSSAIDMPLYQYLLLDVIAFLFVALLIIISITYFSIKFIIVKFIFKRKQKLKSQ